MIIIIFKLLGRKNVNFSNNQGEVISGVTLYGCFQDENVEGYRTEKFFIKNEIEIPDCKLNDTLDLSFNMNGKVEKITKA